MLAVVGLDWCARHRTSSLTQPPSYEAYRAFDEGMEHYLRTEWREALPHFYQAFQLDTAFVTPLIYATLCHNNVNEWGKSDSLVRILEPYRHRLSDYDQHWLGYLKARVDGDNAAALVAIRRAAELAPGSKAAYNQAQIALALNRPQEALDALLSLDPERGPMRGVVPYYSYLSGAYAALGENEKAMEAGQKCREMYGDARFALWYEGTGFARAGRIEQVNAGVDTIFALPEQGLAPGVWTIHIAAELRFQGYTDAARTTIGRAIQWYESRLPETKSSAAWRAGYSAALYVADRWDEAYSVRRSLSAEFPEDLNYRGLLGLLAACRGDRQEALEVSRWLAALDMPYPHGATALWRARIAATLGDGENAVAFFRQAVVEGMIDHPYGLEWIAFERIRDYPPWQELMRPKG